jgi:DNA-binding IclR family transcriptional regulator
MEALSEATGMNVALSIMDGDTLLYLRTADHFDVRYAARAGDHAPLHCTAAGKVFLAHMPDQTLEAFLARSPLEKFTEHTRTDPDALKADLEPVLENGHAVVIQEEFLQVMGIAAPIWDERKKVAACLSLWALTADTAPVAMMEKAGRLKKTAQEITARIQGSARE